MAELGRYKSKPEKKYLKQKKIILNKLSSKFINNNPFLFASRQLVTEIVTRIKIFEKILDVQGDIIECGTFQGNNLMLFAHLSSVFEPYSFNRKIYGFDTFEGFKSISKYDPKDINENTFSNANLNILKKAINLFDLNRSVGHINKINIIKGDATKTIPNFYKKNKNLLISLLYIDFDIFEPTKTALDVFASSVVKGGIIVFDQINYDKFRGESLAFKNYFKANKYKLKKFNHDPFIGYIIM